MNLQLFSKKNQNDHNLVYDIALLSLFIFVGTISRFLLVGWGIQPFPNFELIMVLTFVSIFFIRHILVFLIPLLSMIFSDILLGNPILVGSSMNSIVLFTYTGFLMVSFLLLKTKKISHQSLTTINLKSIGLCIGVGMISTLMYDVWTNAGWWYLMYPHTLETFISVFVAGIPFMIYHQLSTTFTFLTIAIPIGYVLLNKYNLIIPNKHQNFERIPLVLVTLALVLLSFSGSTMAVPNQTDIWLEDSPETSVSITVKGSSWQITDQFILTEQQSVLETLHLLAEKHDFTVDSYFDETFDATMITSINNDINGNDGFYWQYMVNKKTPMTGADNTFVTNGDAILWHFSQFT